jgi:hypothetical protein
MKRHEFAHMTYETSHFLQWIGTKKKEFIIDACFKIFFP